MITRAKFQAFEKVKKSGLTDMMNIQEIRFIAVSKYGQELTDKDCFDLVLYYENHKKKYGKKNQ